MVTAKIFAACLILSAQTYNIAPAALLGIYHVEGGQAGQEVKNTNGSYDIGPMQINSLWLPVLADKWGVSEEVVQQQLRDDICANIDASAWILSTHLKETGNLNKAITYYHSRTPDIGRKYRGKVFSALQRQNLLKE